MNPTNTVHILCIDRVRSEWDRLERELRNAGFSYAITHTSAHEHELQRLCHEGIRPDIVLCPFSLPGTNVLLVLQSVRELGCMAPFILLSFDLAEEIAIELLSSGIEDYITRDNLKRLPVAIRKAIQRHEILTDLQHSHAQLEGSEQAVRNMIRNMPMAVAMFDREMRYLVISETWLAGSGFKEEDLVGKCHYDVVPLQGPQEREIHAHCLEGNTYSNEAEHVRHGDLELWLRIKISPWYDAQDKVGGLIIFVEDITRRVLDERELDEQRDRLALTIEAAHLGVWSWDCSNQDCILSSRGAEIYGFDRTEVSMFDIAAHIHPEDRDRAIMNIQQSLIRKERYSEQYRFIRPDGTEVSVHGQGKALYDDDGLPIKMHGVLIDLTERAAMERKIRESEQLFRDMAENITEVFWLTDAKAKQYLYVSPQFYRLFGISEQSLYVDPLAWETHVHPEDRLGIAERFEKFGPLGTYDEQYRILHPDGRLIWVRDRAFPVRNEQGEVLRIAGICEDITHLKMVQA